MITVPTFAEMRAAQYLEWIRQVDRWLDKVNLHSTDPEFDLIDWYAAWSIGLTPLSAAQAAREAIAMTSFVQAPIGARR